jgi:hypothetical protein
MRTVAVVLLLVILLTLGVLDSASEVVLALHP